MTEIKRRRVATNGIELSVLEAGEGPLVLLVHGFPESAYSWRHQLPTRNGGLPRGRARYARLRRE